MADFVDYVAAAATEDGNNLGNDLVQAIKGIDDPTKLMEWFHGQSSTDGVKFDGVSLEDCKKLIAGKKGIVKYGDLVSVKNGY